jgi:hypothetical protein
MPVAALSKTEVASIVDATSVAMTLPLETVTNILKASPYSPHPVASTDQEDRGL